MVKKALLLSSNRWNSAITEYLISTAHALQSRGWEIQVIVPQSHVVLSRLRKEKLPFVAWQSVSATALCDFLRIRASWHPIWAIGFGGPESWLLWMIPKKYNLQVTRFFGYSFSAPFSLTLHRKFFASFPSVLFPCEALRTACTWVEDSRKYQVTLGLSHKKFFPACTEPSWQKAPTLLIFGRLDPIKGHSQFLSLFAQFLTNLQQTSLAIPCLQIVGKPANTTVAELEALAEGLGISDHVQFCTDHVSHVAALLSKACMGIVCSLGSELICRVAQEFLLCGTPIFISDTGALPEVLFPGAGVSYPLAEDEKMLALLMQAYTLRIQESLATRQERSRLAREHFSLEEMGLQLEAVFKRDHRHLAIARQKT